MTELNITDHIDMIAWDNGDRLVSAPIRGTHPYERFGQRVIEQLYRERRVRYRIIYGARVGEDRVHFQWKSRRKGNEPKRQH